MRAGHADIRCALPVSPGRCRVGQDGAPRRVDLINGEDVLWQHGNAFAVEAMDTAESVRFVVCLAQQVRDRRIDLVVGHLVVAKLDDATFGDALEAVLQVRPGEPGDVLNDLRDREVVVVSLDRGEHMVLHEVGVRTVERRRAHLEAVEVGAVLVRPRSEKASFDRASDGTPLGDRDLPAGDGEEIVSQSIDHGAEGQDAMTKKSRRVESPGAVEGVDGVEADRVDIDADASALTKNV